MMLNKIATKVPFETSVKRPGVEGKAVAVGIPSPDAKTGVSRTPKTATEVALFGRLLTVISVN